MKKDIIKKNFELLMGHFGISNISQMAKEIGMPQTTVNKLVTGETADPRISTLVPVAEHFKISLNDLFADCPKFIQDKNLQESWIPVINFDELPTLKNDINNLTLSNWPHWYPVPVKDYQNCYAIKLKQNQTPRPFDQASLLIVTNDPDLTDNRYCVLKHLKSNSINIKKIAFDKGQYWLLALQPEIPPQKLAEKEWLSMGTIQSFVTDI